MKKFYLCVVFSVAFVFAVHAQRIVSGKITDDSGEELPGVTVSVKGTTSGTVADIDGNYRLSVDDGATLIFSFVGFESQEINVGSRTAIDVAMSGVTELEEVVITGYGDISKRLFTGASSSISSEDIKVDGVVDVSRMLEGRAAGVNVQNVTGTFGAGPKITIRGASSVLGDTKPLWVIDGVVQEDLVDLSFDDLVSGDVTTLIGSSLAGVNANDIVGFEILKDASATAIYGARALNGVIVISTRSGKRNTPLSFSYQGEYTTRTIPNYAQTGILDSKETIGVLKELENKGLLDVTTVGQNRYSGVYGIMAGRINTFDPATGNFLLENTPEARDTFLRQYERANTNWFDVLFKNSLTHNHTFSFSGGGENNVFYTSLAYYGDSGWTIADKVDRVTTNLKNSFFISDNTKITLSFLGSVRQQKAPGTFQRKSDTVFGDISRDFDINPYSYALNTSRTLRPVDDLGNREYYTNNWAPLNILNELENNFIDLRVQDTKFQIDFKYDVPGVDKLSYSFTGAARNVSSVSEHQIMDNSNVVGAYRSNETTIIADANVFLFTNREDLNPLPEVVLPNGGIYIKQDNNLKNFYFRNALHYNHTINLRHDLELFLGQEIRYIDRDDVNFSGYGLQYSRGYVPFTDPRILQKIISEGQDYFGLGQTRERTASFFSRATYGYDGRYFVSYTGNLNASNRVGSIDGKPSWLPTWTVSGKWDLGSESFMVNSDKISRIVSNAQVRASYGLTANTGNATNILPVFRSRVTDRLLVGDRESSIFISDLQNTDLTWEKQFETNIGLDLGLFRNRVSLTADVYRREGFDLIDVVRLSGIGGESAKFINNADMITEGIELSLRTKNIEQGNFKWISTINFSSYKQEVTRLENKPNVLDLVDATGSNLVGFPRNSLFSLRFSGLNDQGLPVFDVPGNDKIAGVDFQDTGVTIEPTSEKPGGLLSYLKYEGTVDPNTVVSLQNTFMYKNWLLGVFISASYGNKIRLPQKYFHDYSDLDVFHADFVNRWVFPGDEDKTNVPVIPDSRLLQDYTASGLSRAYNAYGYSTENVADGGFVRLKTVSLTYQFPKKMIERWGISRLSVKALAQNVFLIYSDERLDGVDPEFYGAGGVAYPITRQYTFSMNIGI